MNGWIKTFRSKLDWEWFTDVPTAHLWDYITMKANPQTETWRGIKIPRGSLVTSEDRLSLETGLTRQQVRTALKKLESTNEITKYSTKTYTMITVNKYDDYQSLEDYLNQPNNQPSTDEITDGATSRATSGATTNKEDKKRRRKEYINIFQKPTLEEVAAYCAERHNYVDPNAWYDFYSANGWKVGKNSMKDWKASIRYWERNARPVAKEELPVYITDKNEQMNQEEADELLKLMGKA